MIMERAAYPTGADVLRVGASASFRSNVDIGDIRDPNAIGALLRFVNALLDGWYEPWGGLPISEY
jgi:hypothetical protein